MRRKHTFWPLIFVILLTFFLAPSLHAAEKKVIEWKFQDTYPSASWTTDYLNLPFIKWIESVTNGRIKITRYEPGALASVKNAFDALSKGVYDMATLYPGFYIGVMPEGNVEQGLPWGWSDAKAHAISLFQFGLFDIMKKVYAKHNLQLLANYTMGDIYNIGTIKPVKTLDDIKGLKIRGVGSFGEYVKALGASPVSVPYGELYMALKMGTIDGYLASSGALVSNKLGEVIKHFLLPTTNSIGFAVAVNKKSWDALPEDIKIILETSAPQVAVSISDIYSGVVEHSKSIAEKKYGVKFHMLSQKDQLKATKLSQPIWDKIAAKTPDCKKAVEAVRATLRHLGRM